MAVEVVIPALGLTVEKGTILKWMKKEGDSVSKGESIYEVEADKVTTEVESPASGVLKKILIPEGVEVPILTPVAIIGDEKEVLPEKYVCAAVATPEKKVEATAPQAREAAVVVTGGPKEIKAPPAARMLAKERDWISPGSRARGLKGWSFKGCPVFCSRECLRWPKGPGHADGSKAGRTGRDPHFGCHRHGARGTGDEGDVMEAKATFRPAEARRKPSEIKPVSKYRLGQVIPMNSMRKVIAKRMSSRSLRPLTSISLTMWRWRSWSASGRKSWLTLRRTKEFGSP